MIPDVRVAGYPGAVSIDEDRKRLEYSVCIPTLNRLDILLISIKMLLCQTRLPKQIIIVDASDDVESNGSKVAEASNNFPIEVIYQGARDRSSASQRNQALESVNSDIVLFIDDDSLLFPNCGQEIIRIFEEDTSRLIAGVALKPVEDLPTSAHELINQQRGYKNPDFSRKTGGSIANGTMLRKLEGYALWRFIRRELLMQAMDRMFVPYDRYRWRAMARRGGGIADDMTILRHLPGYGMAVRSHVARLEQFNPYLLAYCPCEDLDVSYRYGRHGLCVLADRAKLNHFEVEASRIGRTRATSLGISNVALFVKLNSDSMVRHTSAFAVFVLRRLLGEFFKDVLARRVTLPQFRGVIQAIPRSIGVLMRSPPQAQRWYRRSQMNYLYPGRPNR